MKHVPVLGKVLSVVAALAIFIVGTTFFSTTKMRFIDDTYSDISDHQGAATAILAGASRASWGMRGSIAELMIASSVKGNNVAKQGLATQRSDFTGYMDTAAQLLPNHATEFAVLKQRGLSAVDATCVEAIRLGEATDQASVLQSQAVYGQACAPALAQLSADLRTAVDGVIKEGKVLNNETTLLTESTIRNSWGLILGGLLLALVSSAVAVRTWVSKPLVTLSAAMTRIASGDYAVEIAGGDRRDEVGVMARVAQVFITTGQEKIALEEQAGRQRQVIEAQRLDEAAAQKRLADQQAETVSILATGLERLSSGDLMARIDTTFAPEYEKLRSNFNGAVAKLQDTMTVISGVTSAIRSGTAEISSASDDLSRRTEQQAASLEETAAALDEITATVKKTSDGSIHARTVVSNTKADAERSGTVVGQAIEAMSAIEQSAQKVTQIIGVIDEIAFQTNLLALNAGVEAARAGEAGRGFAVVASEVRALAQRSAEAAKEIKALISTSSQQVSTGVDLVNETGDALKRIVSQVAEINAVVSDIATSTQEQATALQEVNTAINQMDQVTQQNAAMVEQSTAASKNLASETEQLSALVSEFKLGRPSPAEGQGRRLTKAAPPGRTVAAPAPKRAMKVANGGAVANSNDWEEF